MDRSASAVWHGSLKEGSGTISTQSGTLKDTQYSFKARFADGVGTNPEELHRSRTRRLLHHGIERPRSPKPASPPTRSRPPHSSPSTCTARSPPSPRST